MGKIKNEKIPLGFTVVSLDDKSLFTSVPLTENEIIVLNLVVTMKFDYE